jgi:hypothetical protein
MSLGSRCNLHTLTDATRARSRCGNRERVEAWDSVCAVDRLAGTGLLKREGEAGSLVFADSGKGGIGKTTRNALGDPLDSLIQRRDLRAVFFQQHTVTRCYLSGQGTLLDLVHPKRARRLTRYSRSSSNQ